MQRTFDKSEFVKRGAANLKRLVQLRLTEDDDLIDLIVNKMSSLMPKPKILNEEPEMFCSSEEKANLAVLEEEIKFDLEMIWPGFSEPPLACEYPNYAPQSQV